MWGLLTRANLLFALGALGFTHELFIQERERPFVLAASVTMMGLKFAIKGDEMRNGGGE